MWGCRSPAWFLGEQVFSGSWKKERIQMCLHHSVCFLPEHHRQRKTGQHNSEYSSEKKIHHSSIDPGHWLAKRNMPQCQRKRHSVPEPRQLSMLLTSEKAGLVRLSHTEQSNLLIFTGFWESSCVGSESRCGLIFSQLSNLKAATDGSGRCKSCDYSFRIIL